MYYGDLQQKTLRLLMYARVNQKMQVFTPELWQFVCLIFGLESRNLTLKMPNQSSS